MDHSDQLRMLQEQVNQLSGQVSDNKAKIEQLEQQLQPLIQRLTAASNNSALHKRYTKPQIKEGIGLENFIGLRLIHIIGIIVLVIGLSIGVKYAIDRDLISATARILLAYSAGAILFFLALRLKVKYQAFSAILFSGAMASLYVTTYAAFVYYGLFSSLLAFLIMIVLTFYTAYTALLYDKKEIALLGLVGAYAIPFLISSNSDKAVLFFTYISLINMGVVFLVYKKEWSVVGQLAQLITWILFLGWSFTRYNSSQQWVALLFMMIFFLLFTVSALARQFKTKKSLTLKETQQLLLNNIALFIACCVLFAPHGEQYKMTAVSGYFCLFVALQALLYYKLLPIEKPVINTHASMALLLFMAFIAYQWDGVLVTLLWLATAVVIFILGVYYKSNRLRMASIVLMGITLVKLVAVDSLRFSALQKIIAYITLGVLLLVVSFFYQKFKNSLFGEDET